MNNLISMSPVMPYIVLLAGFVLLIKGADYFVDGCSSVARLFHIPPIIIGLTIAAFGTSAPEAAVSITSSLKGANAMAVSNVLGSNLFNLLIVIGACSIIKPIKVSIDIIKRDYPINIVITVVMLLICTNYFSNGFNIGVIGRFDGILLLVIFTGYILLLIKNTLKNRKLEKQNNSFIENDNNSTVSVSKSIFFIIAGAAAIAFGGNCVVDSATSIAESFNVSQTLIGLTIVALGTSLPELVTSLVAAKKGENDLAVGNVVGSNLFNILFVLGIAATVSPIHIEVIANPLFTIYDTIFLLTVSIIVYLFILLKKNINRIEGALMVLIYAGYLVYIIQR